LCFATDKYSTYVEEAKCRQEGCIGDRIPSQLWRGALVSKVLYSDDGWVPAGAGRRGLATLLDMALYCSLCALLATPVGRQFDWGAALGGIDDFARTVSDHIWLAHASGILGLWVALWWCYFVVGWGLLGATPGKWAMGLRIMDYRQHCPIGPARALLRLAAYCVSSVTLEWGHFLILIRTDRRALHDILAGTRVVRRTKQRRLPEPEPDGEAKDEEVKS